MHSSSKFILHLLYKMVHTDSKNVLNYRDTIWSKKNCTIWSKKNWKQKVIVNYYTIWVEFLVQNDIKVDTNTISTDPLMSLHEISERCLINYLLQTLHGNPSKSPSSRRSHIHTVFFFVVAVGFILVVIKGGSNYRNFALLACNWVSVCVCPVHLSV